MSRPVAAAVAAWLIGPGQTWYAYRAYGCELSFGAAAGEVAADEAGAWLAAGLL
jgi:hypothetical protein